MKKNHFFFSALCLLFPLLSFAQSTLGIFGGLNLSDVTVKGGYTFRTSPQLHEFFGLSNRTTFNRHWALCTEAQYTMRGYNVDYLHSEERYKMDYLDLSSKIEYTVFKNIGLLLGAYGGYRLAEYTNAPNGRWIKRVYPITDDWDIGLQAGFAAHFKRWTVFANYSHGIIPAGKIEGIEDLISEKFDTRIYNQGLQIGLRYSVLKW